MYIRYSNILYWNHASYLPISETIRYWSCCLGHTAGLPGTQSRPKLWAPANNQRCQICPPKCGHPWIEVSILALYSNSTLDEIREQHELLCGDLHEIHPKCNQQNEIENRRRAFHWTITSRTSNHEWEGWKNRLHYGTGPDFSWNRYGNSF